MLEVPLYLEERWEDSTLTGADSLRAFLLRDAVLFGRQFLSQLVFGEFHLGLGGRRVERHLFFPRTRVTHEDCCGGADWTADEERRRYSQCKY